MNSEVFLGDAVRATLALNANSAARLEIAKLLGLHRNTFDIIAEDPKGAAIPSFPEAPDPPGFPEPSPPVGVEPRPQANPVTVRLIGNTGRPAAATAQLASIESLPSPEVDLDQEPAEPEPLFSPKTVSALLTTALTVSDPRGPLEVHRMVHQVAHCRPLTEVREYWGTLSYGVQMLVDVGAGMMPFDLDCTDLQRKVSAVIGTRATMLRFLGCPSRGAGTGPPPWPRYRSPQRPTPILLVTDLGIARTGAPGEWAAADEWLRFATDLRRDGHRVVAFVPYPRERVPSLLTKALNVVQWDRATTVQSVHRRCNG
jgi:hypothetical protein